MSTEILKNQLIVCQSGQNKNQLTARLSQAFFTECNPNLRKQAKNKQINNQCGLLFKKKHTYWVALNNSLKQQKTNLFSLNFGGWKSKIKVPADTVSGKSSLSGL